MGTPSMIFDTNTFVYPGRPAQEKASGLRPAAQGTVSWNTVNGAAQYRRHQLSFRKRNFPQRASMSPCSADVDERCKNLVRT